MSLVDTPGSSAWGAGESHLSPEKPPDARGGAGSCGRALRGTGQASRSHSYGCLSAALRGPRLMGVRGWGHLSPWLLTSAW